MTYRIIYSSTAQPEMGDADFRSIAMFGAVNNTAHGVTGLLLNYDTHIMQVLEGPKEPVKQLFANICKDKRHHHIKMISSGEVPKAEFTTWSMGYRPLSEPIDMDLHFALSEMSLKNALPDDLSDDIQQHVTQFTSQVKLGQSPSA